MILHKKILLVDKANDKHKPNIFTKKILRANAGRCLESFDLVRALHSPVLLVHYSAKETANFVHHHWG